MINLIWFFKEITSKQLIFYCCLPFFTAFIPFFTPLIYYNLSLFTAIIYNILSLFSMDIPYLFTTDYWGKKMQCFFGPGDEAGNNARPTYVGDTRQPRNIFIPGIHHSYTYAINEEWRKFNLEIEKRRTEAGLRGNNNPDVTLNLIEPEQRELEKKLKKTNYEAPLTLSDFAIIKVIATQRGFDPEVEREVRGLSNGLAVSYPDNYVPHTLSENMRLRLLIQRESEDIRKGNVRD